MKKAVQRLPLILASASPRRRRLMKTLPWPFRVKVSGVREPEPRPGTPPGAFARRLALLKARAVARRLGGGLVLGADTLVHQKGRIFGKPRSRAHARRMLARLSSDWHTVYTGLALVASPGGRVWGGVWATKVRMRSLTSKELDYWSSRHHDKAGAYAAQEKGDPFVEDLRGDYDNVVGLPRRGVRFLLKRARRAGFHVETALKVKSGK